MSKHHVITLDGITLIPDHSGALYAPDFKTLIVSDLHLEHGVSLARRGIHVPPFDTGMTLSLLEHVVAAIKPWRLVLLGDSFHDATAHESLMDQHRSRLQDITAQIETIWISGNHDPSAPVGLGGVCVSEHKLDHVVLRHEPTRGRHHCEIAGHLHPGATIVQRGVATRGKCFIADERRLIMPAFGAYTGALAVTGPAFSGLFDERSANIWMLGRSAIHQFPRRRVS